MSVRLTPWARTGLSAAGVDLSELRRRMPAGFHFYGDGRSVRGPYRYQLHNYTTGEGFTIHAATWEDVKAALDHLFASVAVKA